jgi:hypothetical protein
MEIIADYFEFPASVWGKKFYKNFDACRQPGGNG